LQRDSFSGWGRLDIAKALASLDGVLPAADRLEPNDDAGAKAVKLTAATKTVSATLDFWNDQRDVYRVYLRKGQRLRLTFKARAGRTPTSCSGSRGHCASPTCARSTCARRSRSGPGPCTAWATAPRSEAGTSSRQSSLRAARARTS
jgi:hypothetical protein